MQLEFQSRYPSILHNYFSECYLHPFLFRSVEPKDSVEECLNTSVGQIDNPIRRLSLSSDWLADLKHLHLSICRINLYWNGIDNDTAHSFCFHINTAIDKCPYVVLIIVIQS